MTQAHFEIELCQNFLTHSLRSIALDVKMKREGGYDISPLIEELILVDRS